MCIAAAAATSRFYTHPHSFTHTLSLPPAAASAAAAVIAFIARLVVTLPPVYASVVCASVHVCACACARERGREREQ